MSFAITMVMVCAGGLALLRLLRLATGNRALDVALAWLVGSGWMALGAMVLRFVVGLRLSAASLAGVSAAPIAAWAIAVRLRVAGPAAGEPLAPAGSAATPRWIPRPRWLFAPVVAYVLVVLVAAALHGFNTPTQTDDGVRVRAFTPMLAFLDSWGSEARRLLVTAGPVPTFVPALAWIFTGSVQHFHVNYVVLADLAALLVLTVGVPSSRGSPERGWACALALMSLPLFVYHCTSTHQDAVLAMFLAAGFVFALEYARTRAMADAARAMALFVVASWVKREGELVAAGPILVLLANAAWAAWRDEGRLRRPVALLWLGVAVPMALVVVARIAAAGTASAFPFLALAADRAAALAPAAPAPGGHGDAAGVFAYALFTSGNAGLTFWLVPAAIALRPRALLRPELAWPFATAAALFAEVAASALWLVPQYTLDQTTVHRALIAATLPAALWVAVVIADAAERGQRVGAKT